MGEAAESRPGRPRSEIARRAILRASLDLLRRHGLSGVTAEAVAERAKVSKATLYRWWPCAAATAMDAFFEEVFGHLRTVASDDPLQELRSRLRQGTELMAGELGDVLAGLIATTHTDPRIAESFQQRYVEPGRADFRALLSRAVDAGALRPDVDLELAIDVISGPFFYRKMICHRTTGARAREIILGYVLDGLAARPGASRASVKSASARASRRASAPIRAAGRRKTARRSVRDVKH
jgi:AcrR family transcriptional regulator